MYPKRHLELLIAFAGCATQPKPAKVANMTPVLYGDIFVFFAVLTFSVGFGLFLKWDP